MNNIALVSVIMPTYNDKSAYLQESIESILRQSYSNIELIIADDSTKEETKAIIDEFAIRDKRIKVVRETERMGLCHASNAAIKEAHGQYIARMDADDVSFPERLELQMRAFTSDSIAVVGGQLYSFYDGNDDIAARSKYPLSAKAINDSFNKGRNPIAHPTTIIRKCVLEEVGGYDELFKCSEDYDIWQKIRLKYDIINIPEFVLKYRLHDDNGHVSYSNLQSKLCCISHVKYAMGISRNLTKEEYDVLFSFVQRNLLCRLYSFINLRRSIIARGICKFRLDGFPSLIMIKLFSRPSFSKRLFNT